MKTTQNKIESIEKNLWNAADKLHKNIDAAEYKHVAVHVLAEVIIFAKK